MVTIKKPGSIASSEPMGPTGHAAANSVPALVEIATGRFYLDGEPEVRLRSEIEISGGCLLVITVMGDGIKPVGLTASIFRITMNESQYAVENSARDDVNRRITDSGGTVVDQTVKFIEGPNNVAAFIVVEMLEASKRMGSLVE